MASAEPPVTDGTDQPVTTRQSRPDEQASSSTRVAHTLTACTRCRQRKTRCDPGLPRCGPCERNNGVCEYWDPGKKCNVRRDYVVWLQHRAHELQQEIARLQNEDATQDPELMIRNPAAVRVQDADESKFLGPSSGTQIIRLVMQLAKLFTDSKTIKDIVPDARARQVQELYAVEEAKPTSKVYPLISSVAAEELPNPELVNLLYQLYCLKVQPMYPVLHEPTLALDMEAAQKGTADDFQNFITRMVIAVSLQKMDAQYAGLADSYYLAALKYMEAVVRKMDIKTLQAFALIAEYSLLTPTRTAIYYICGLAVRLTQALGIHEEASITRGEDGGPADPLTVDMRRRVFWCIWTMEAGLSHALGRPMSLATGRDHLDVQSFELCDDQYITAQGVLPGARPVLKKWIAMHFFKMRLIQLEVRRKLYQKKRPTPKDDQDPWFQDILARLDAWRDASPESDEGAGLNKVWFIGRYNTIIAMLYRPCPQIPRPSLTGAIKCFDAAKYNIYMVKEQVRSGTVSMTWIFTQALFMAINTMLWSLSYAEVRKTNPRHEVEQHLAVALESVVAASDRWPGVASAHALYIHIIEAVLKIYDKTGDVTVAIGTPSDEPSPLVAGPRSRTTSPPQPPVANSAAQSMPRPFGNMHYRAGSGFDSSGSDFGTPSYNNSPSSKIPNYSYNAYQSSNPSPDEVPPPPQQQYQRQQPHRLDRPPTSYASVPAPQYSSLPAGFSHFPDSNWLNPADQSGQLYTPAYGSYESPAGAHTRSQPSTHKRQPHQHPAYQQQQQIQRQHQQDQASLLMTQQQQFPNAYTSPEDTPHVLDPTYWHESVGRMPHPQQPEDYFGSSLQAQTAYDFSTAGGPGNGDGAIGQYDAFMPFGLSTDQQHELLQSLETNGMGDIETMIAGANMILNPGQQHGRAAV